MSRRPRIVSTAVKASLFGLLALSSLALSGCRHRERQHDDSAFTWDGPLAAPATVQVRNSNGSISVVPSADDQLHVLAATSWTRGDPKRDIQFRVVSAGNIVTVCAMWENGACSATEYASKKSRNRFSIRRSSRSDATVAFTVQVPAGVRVDAWTLVGDVTVRAAGPVKARTMSGDIKVGTAVGPVNAETMTGDVDVRMTTVGDTGAIRAVTMNGDAVAWVPEISDGRLDASTLNGDIGSDFGGFTEASSRRPPRFQASIGTGAREYQVKSMNGSAWLRLINADGSVGLKQDGAAATSAAPASPAGSGTRVKAVIKQLK